MDSPAVARYYEDPIHHPRDSCSAMTADHSSLPSGDPASPCVGVCVINPQTQLCEGCFRTLDEIAGWWDYAPEQKRAVLAELDDRLARIIDGTFFD
jgi:hypothetical protein